MSNLLKDASILLTPTAYENGRMNAIKPYKDLYGPELVTNGDFATDSDWTKGFGWSISSGTANANSASSSYFYQNINELGVGKTYKVTYTITSYTSGSVVTGIGDFLGSRGVTRNAIGTYTDTITFVNNTANSYFGFFATSSFTGSIDNVSVVEDLSGDFNFERNSAATRVNAQGLVENVQIISPELVSNGNFSQIGTEEVSNGDFSEIGSDIVTDGNFPNGSTAWDLNGWTISGNTANGNGLTANLIQSISGSANKNFSLTFTISNYISGSVIPAFVGNSSDSLVYSSNGTFTEVISSGSDIRFVFYGASFNASISNVSVKEVGQDWTLGTGWSIGDDVAVFDDTTTNRISQTGLSITSGKSYKINFTIADCPTTAHMTIYDGGGSDLIVPNENYVNGSYTRYYTATTNETGVSFWGNTAGDTFTITNISVKEVGQDWDLGTGWSIGEDKAICDGTQTTFTGLIQDNVFTSGKTYKLTFNIVSNSQQFNFWVNGSQNIFATSFLSDGFKDYTFTASASGNAYFEASSSFVGSVTNISVKEITDDTDLPRINYEGFSYQDSLGSELVTNGDFATDSDWTKETGWTISGGTANYSGGTNNRNIRQAIGITNGKKYKVQYEVTAITSGEVACRFGGMSGINEITATTKGTYVGYITANSSANGELLIEDNNNNFIGSIDNVSVKEVLGQEVVPDSGCGSWLLEPQSTNLITYSEDFSNAAWAKSNVIITPNQGISPSGLNNAFKYVGSSISQNVQTTINVSSNYTYSFYVKTINSPFIRLRTSDGSCWFNMTTNAVATNNFASAEIKNIGNNWYRLSVTSSSFTSSNSFFIHPHATDNTTVEMDGAEFLLWGAQVEQQSFSTSYIPTSGAASTRLQDIATNSGNSTLINSTEGVLYAEMAALADDGTNRTIALNKDTNDRIQMYFDASTNGLSIFYKAQSGATAFVMNQTLTDTTLFNKIAFKWKTNDFSLWINGTKTDTVSSGVTPNADTLNSLDFKMFNSSNTFYGKAKAVAVYKEALTDSNLRCLTYPNPVATTFDLDFDTIAEQFTFTRGSEATFVNAQGLIESTNQLGPELVTNGDFATDSDWTLSGSNVSISGGKLNFVNATSNSEFAQQSIVAPIGKTYKITLDVSNLGSGESIKIRYPFQDITINTNGTHILYGVGNTANFFRLTPSSSTASFSIDNVSVKEVISATNTPRIDYSTGAEAFLLEPQSTNLITYSEDFSNASWGKQATIVDANSIISADGTQNASKIQGTQTGSALVSVSYPTLTVGNTYTFSCFAKKGNNDWIRLAHISSGGTGCWFDLENGVVGTVNSQSATIEDYGNGWYKCTNTFIATASTDANLVFIGICDADGSTNAGIVGQNDYLWGAQLEQKSYATSYIPTSGATATRNQELCNNATPVINSEEGTLYAEFQGLSSSVGNKVISLNDGTNTNAFWLYIISSSNGIRIYDGATIGTYFLVNAFENNKFALVYNSTNTRLFINGSLAITIPFKSMSNLNKISFSDGNEGQKFEGNTKGLKYYPKALADVQLEDLTTI